MSNEWATPEHALDYLQRKDDIPHRIDGERTLLEEVPVEAARVLDLGCGDGHLLALVLTHCRNATGIGLDLSATMLAEAAQRFGNDPCVELIAHDLEDPLPELTPCDVVVSSFAIHHCQHDRKRRLYREVWSLLAPGGVFANLEHVASPNKRVHLRFLDAMGMTPADEDPSNKLLDVTTQLDWLEEIGFEDVDCYWKWRELALIIGRKR